MFRKQEHSEHDVRVTRQGSKILKVLFIFLGTVRNNRLTATATDQEVECYIKRWLHLASDRDGGRRKREERRQTFQNICKSVPMSVL